jgi:hypothetical protein
VIWQRLSAHRAPAVPGHGGQTARRVRAWRHERRARAASMPPLVIREPEAGWWETQPDLDERPAAPPGGDVTLGGDTMVGSATMTVAVLPERDADTDAVVARLAELAVADELVVVFGSASCAHPGQHAVIAGLRGRLPRHHVVAVHVRNRGADLRRHGAALERFLDDGSLPVVVTASTAMHDVTAAISSYVRADRVLRVFRTATGADLYQVWHRQPEPGVN